MSRMWMLLAIFAAVPLGLWAQASSAHDGFSSGNSGVGRPDESSGVRTNARSANSLLRDPQLQRPIYLSGSVVLASGGRPLEPVLIRRVCGSDNQPEGYTDSKGRFNFLVGGGSSTAAFDARVGGQSNDELVSGRDASAGRLAGVNPSMGIDLSGCSLVVDAPGYQSSPIRLSRMHSMDRSNVGTFILKALGGDGSISVSLTTLEAPNDARKAFEKAMKEIRKGETANVKRVIGELEKAVAAYPDYAVAWAFLGQSKGQSGDVAGGIQALRKAMTIDPLYIKPYEPLILLRIGQQDWRRVAELTEIALQINPGDGAMRWFRVLSQYELGEYDEATRLLGAIEGDEVAARLYPQTHHIRGLIHARQGRFEEAASEYRRYLEIDSGSAASDRIKREMHDWQELGVLEFASAR